VGAATTRYMTRDAIVALRLDRIIRICSVKRLERYWLVGFDKPMPVGGGVITVDLLPNILQELALFYTTVSASMYTWRLSLKRDIRREN